MEELIDCPVCRTSESLSKTFASVRDHALTGEVFTISNCKVCGLLATNPRPSAEEIGRYYDFPNYVSHRDDAPGLINRLYQLARRYTTQNKVRLIERINNGRTGELRLLDYGCGTGFFLQAAKDKGWQVTGVEVSRTARNAAKERLQLSVFETLSEVDKNKQYSTITLWHVLEHIHDLNETLADLISRLTADGSLIIAVPNSEAADTAYYKEYWAAYDVPRHLYHFAPQTIQRLMQQHGARVVEQIGQPLDAFYIGLLSEKYRQGSAIKGLFNGVRANIDAWKTGNYSSIIYVVKKSAS